MLCICPCRSSSRPERRSSAPTSRPSSPSWETAAPRIWGKVCAGGSERGGHARGQSHDPRLVSVFDAYMKMTGYEMEESINRETSGNLKTLLLAVGKEALQSAQTWPLWTTRATFKRLHLLSCSSSVKCARSVPAYFAETLYYAMKVRWNPSLSQTYSNWGCSLSIHSVIVSWLTLPID